MDSGEGLGDDHSPPATSPPRKDHVTVAEPPPMLDAAAAIESGDSELDCSHDILQPAGISWVAVDDSDGRDRPLAVSGSNELGDKLAERKENVQGPDHKASKEMKHNLDPVCEENTRCGQERVKLRRQREEACELARCLQDHTDILEHTYQRDIDRILGMLGEVQAEHRRISALQEENMRHMQEELATGGRYSLRDAIVNLELQSDVERLRKELLLKEEELRSLNERFHRSVKTSEKTYMAAMEENIRLNAMLQNAHETLEAEVDVVSCCPPLMQLLCSLRAGGGAGREATSLVHTSPCPSPGGNLVNLDSAL